MPKKGKLAHFKKWVNLLQAQNNNNIINNKNIIINKKEHF